jgi:hypothetical protein
MLYRTVVAVRSQTQSHINSLSSTWKVWMLNLKAREVTTTHTHTHVHCAVLKRLSTLSDFHIPLPSIVPFAHSETPFTHGCRYLIFPGSSGTTSFFPSFMFPVDHTFWQSHWVQSLNMSIQNELFSGNAIQYRILRVHFSSNILIRFYI